MARKIRGWIINLLDGLGPPPSTVHVRATSQATNNDLNLEDDGLGRLNHVHVLGGSVSDDFADNIGHFGWDMELSPGPIDVYVNPTDPQNEYRRRFPDESSQVGKAFISDLERVGWAAGSSGVIWDAVPNGYGVPSIWTLQPQESSAMGNGSVASFGQGADAGRFVIRPFIALLGGVPFTVEMGDLMVPIKGQPAAPPNGSSNGRWDLFCAVMNDDPSSPDFGKQSFELTQSPAGIFPLFPGSTAKLRRIPLHVLRMPHNSSQYTEAWDVRPWLNAPGNVSWPYLRATVGISGDQELSQNVGDTSFPAAINSHIPAMLTALSTSYYGTVTLECTITLKEVQTSVPGIAYVRCTTTGINVGGGVATGNLTPGAGLSGSSIEATMHIGHQDWDNTHSIQTSNTWNMEPISSYSGSSTGGIDLPRNWQSVKVSFEFNAINYARFTIHTQRVLIRMYKLN